MNHLDSKGRDDFERHGVFDQLVDLGVVDIPGFFDRHVFTIRQYIDQANPGRMVYTHEDLEFFALVKDEATNPFIRPKFDPKVTRYDIARGELVRRIDVGIKVRRSNGQALWDGVSSRVRFRHSRAVFPFRPPWRLRGSRSGLRSLGTSRE